LLQTRTRDQGNPALAPPPQLTLFDPPFTRALHQADLVDESKRLAEQNGAQLRRILELEDKELLAAALAKEVRPT